jgi:nitrite reductase (NADH) small subunit
MSPIVIETLNVSDTSVDAACNPVLRSDSDLSPRPDSSVRPDPSVLADPATHTTDTSHTSHTAHAEHTEHTEHTASMNSLTTTVTTTHWVTVCKQSDLIPGRGVAALIGTHQYALFLTEQGDLFAIDNRDPFCDANVMARGIIGDRNGEPKVASPMLKQTFSLQTGICFEDPTVTITTHRIRATPTNTIEIQVSAP